MNILLQIVLCSEWGMIIADEFQPFKNVQAWLVNRLILTNKSGKWNLFKSALFLFIQAVSCSKCLSFHLFWISWLILYGNFQGVVYGAGSYFLTMVFRKLIP